MNRRQLKHEKLLDMLAATQPKPCSLFDIVKRAFNRLFTGKI